MWLSLADSKLVESYRKNCFLPDEFPEQVALLLERLSQKPYAEKLSAVTSLSHLYLTTALSWDDTSDNDSIGINQRIDAGKPVIVISYHKRSANKSVSGRVCSLEEAVEYIDLYVMRLLLEKYGEL